MKILAYTASLLGLPPYFFRDFRSCAPYQPITQFVGEPSNHSFESALERALTNFESVDWLERYGPQLGEIAQHEINVDMKIVETSNWYLSILDQMFARHPEVIRRNPTRMLEIACYRHVFSYKLAADRGFEATLFDVSDHDLEAGRKIASELDFPLEADRVAGEFHNLPFSDAYFDLVYVSAALHHTRRPEVVIGEAMRVLSDGGHFYCQREPVERLFCFFKFPGNRSYAFTEFEKYLLKRDLTRIICSPFPGARNALMFGRIENDRIPLDSWLNTLSRHGEIVEEVIYHEGLLTGLDREILARAEMSEPTLARFVANRLRDEIDLAAPKMTRQDQLLGHLLPTEPEIINMARRVASALKARNSNPSTLEWRRQMGRIFGASTRFLVRRKRGDVLRASKKYRRETAPRGNVRLDNAAYDPILFWQRLLPDLPTASEEEIARIFPPSDWSVSVQREGVRIMGSKGAEACITPQLGQAAVVAMRFRILLDDDLPLARLTVTYDDRDVSSSLIPQTEDQVIKIFCDKPEGIIRLILQNEYGETVRLASRIRVNVIQAVPVLDSPLKDRSRRSLWSLIRRNRVA
jgi:SAM-dependent methyltransferase